MTSRRDELANLRDDFQDRLTRRRPGAAGRQAGLGGDPADRARARRRRRPTRSWTRRPRRWAASWCRSRAVAPTRPCPCRRTTRSRRRSLGDPVSGPSAIFRLSGGQGLWITVSLGLPTDAPLAADIVFRYLQRLCQALAERLERLQYRRRRRRIRPRRGRMRVNRDRVSASGTHGLRAPRPGPLGERSSPGHASRECRRRLRRSNRWPRADAAGDPLASPASGARG